MPTVGPHTISDGEYHQHCEEKWQCDLKRPLGCESPCPAPAVDQMREEPGHNEEGWQSKCVNKVDEHIKAAMSIRIRDRPQGDDCLFDRDRTGKLAAHKWHRGM